MWLDCLNRASSHRRRHPQVLVSRDVGKIASRALADREEEVAQALERGVGLAEFARTMALQVPAAQRLTSPPA